MDERIRRARALRNNPTDAEQRLWWALRQRRMRGYKFRRQRPIGRYIVDFASLERRVVIEVDGAHHAKQRAYDTTRDRYLRSRGYEVLRFSDREVLTELDAVLQAIWKATDEVPHPSPPPLAGEGIRRQ